MQSVGFLQGFALSFLFSERQIYTSRKVTVCLEYENVYLMVGLIVLMNVIKGLSLEWEPRKMKKMSPIKHFQKYTKWRKVRIMVRSSFPMKKLAQGGAILAAMEVPRISCICVYELYMNQKVLCLMMKSSIMRTIWGSGQFLGSRRLYSFMK